MLQNEQAMYLPCKPFVAKWMSMGCDQKAKSSVKGWSTWVWPSLNPASTFHAPPTQHSYIHQLHHAQTLSDSSHWQQPLTVVNAASTTTIIMATMRSRCRHYILQLWFLLFFLSSCFFLLLSLFSLPIISRRRLDVYHTTIHGVALVQI